MLRYKNFCRFAVTVVLLTCGNIAVADVLTKVRESGKISLGYREDAEPFSFINAQGVPDGYSVKLCQAAANHVKTELKLSKLDIEYVPVNSANRFKALEEGKIDLLCGATTATLARRKIVDFSIPTFVTGATVVVRRGGPQGMQEMNGKKIGVLAATTTAKGLLQLLQRAGINAEVIPVSSHSEGFAKLKSGELSAYFGDRAILVTLFRRNQQDGDIGISSKLFSIEPYALALPLGDNAFRLAVDTALSKTYRTPLIQQIYTSAFGNEPLGDLLQGLYAVNALPE